MTDEQKWSVLSIGIEESGDFLCLDSQREVYNKAEEYTNEGIKILKSQMDKYGQNNYPKALERELKDILGILEPIPFFWTDIMIPSNITRTDIIKALEQTKREGTPPNRISSKYQLVYRGDIFPPKYIVSLANLFANGSEHPASSFSGGSETNAFLSEHGFTIIRKRETPRIPEQKTKKARTAPVPTNHSQTHNTVRFDDEEILSTLIRFEYLTNAMKLQYLIDSLEHDINKETVAFFYQVSAPEDILSSRMLHSPYGRSFALYLNRPVYKGGGLGNLLFPPLLTGYHPECSPLVEELNTVNAEIIRLVKTEENWLPILCEFIMIKTSVHELVVDVDDNQNDWGYSDLMGLAWYLKQNKPISISLIREYIVQAFRLGLDPSDIRTGTKTETEPIELKNLDYVTFSKKRNEWSDYASNLLTKAVPLFSRERIALVMNWQKYSLCAFDCGPVFMRKKRELLYPKICTALSDYQGWDSNKPVYKMMTDIVGENANIIIGRYWDYFGPNIDTVGYFTDNKEKLADLKEKLCILKDHYNNLLD